MRNLPKSSSDGAAGTLYVLAKRKYTKNYVKKVKTDSGEVRIYDDAHVKSRWKKKVEQLGKIRSALPKLRKQYKSDMNSDDEKVRALATVVAIIDQTAMRVGNDGSAEDFETYGATTLLKKHIAISGSKLTFKFKGKRGVDQKFQMTDARVASSLRELLSGKSGTDFAFEYDEGKRIRAKVVNRYLALFNITAKDLRGFHANRLFDQKMSKSKDFMEVVEEVAEEIGHEPKTLMNQYLDPKKVMKYKKADTDVSNFINKSLEGILPGAERPVPKTPAAPATKPVPSGRPAIREKVGPDSPAAHSHRITSPYGDREHPISGKFKHHDGVDIGGKIGTPVYAIDKGTVIHASMAGNAGNMVKIQHIPEDWTTVYMHLSKFDVKKGDTVVAGQKIGEIGQTGGATGPHLHFEVRFKNEPADPTKYIEKHKITG